ncbi:MAG: hypothetical protein CMD76_01210 [Gammaproteobacteria bacterium]|nr:hypothetical protein [Gammaproteobacteria bacterium]
MRLLFIILICLTFFSCANNVNTFASVEKDLKDSTSNQEIKCVYERRTGSYIKKRVCYDNQLEISRYLETQSAIRQMDIFPMHLEPFYR